MNLIFSYRTDYNPVIRKRVFAEKRTNPLSGLSFLYQGRTDLEDGFTTVDGHVVSYSILRPLMFIDTEWSVQTTSQVAPGFHGLRRLNFRGGRVGIYSPAQQVGTVLVSASAGSRLQFLSGRITISATTNLGALTAFAIWKPTLEDPYDFYIENATDLASGGVQEPFTRMYATFVPHRDTQYLGIGSKVYDLANVWPRRQTFKKWMVEKTEVGRTVPSAKYAKAREVRVRVHADRINYAINPKFDSDTTGWSVSGGTLTRVTSTSRSGPASGQLVTAAPQSAYTDDIPVNGDQWVAVSVYVQGDGEARIHVEADPGAVTIGSSTSALLDSSWRRFTVVVKTPESAEAISVSVDQLSTGNHTLYISDLLVERDEVVREYFDGSTSADTLWETGGVPGNTRSYFYKNRVERYAAIKRVLEDNVPLGIGIAEPEFATLPAD